MRNARIPSNPKPPNAHSARHKQFALLIVFILFLQHTDAAKFQLRVYTLIIAYTISRSASMSNFFARQDAKLCATEKRSEFLLFKPFPLSDYSLLKKIEPHKCNSFNKFNHSDSSSQALLPGRLQSAHPEFPEYPRS